MLRQRSWYVPGIFAVLVAASTGLYIGCRTPIPQNGGSAVKDTVADTPAFAQVQLQMDADSKTGDVFARFDAAAAGLQAGQQVVLAWDVTAAKGTVNCSALRRKENVTIPAGGPVELSFKVEPSSLTDTIPTNQQMAVPEEQADKEDKFALFRQGRNFQGSIVVEGCIMSANGAVLGSARNAPEAGSTEARGLRLAEISRAETGPVHIRYAERCAEAIGYVPPMNCLEMGQAVPIHKDGVEQTSVSDTCDRPVYLEGPNRCGPFTRTGRLKLFKTKALTEERTDSVATFFCRHYGDASTMNSRGATGANYPMFADVAIIMQNKTTGKSCYFQALGSGESLYGKRVPPPYETDNEFNEKIAAGDRDAGAAPASSFWLAPSAIAGIHCVSCHDNDPFMHSPWIDQVKVLANGQPTSKLLVPSQPFVKYQIIGAGFGFERWDTSYSFDSSKEPMDSNACLSCHRISTMKTCREWVNDAFPVHANGRAPKNTDFYLNTTGEGERLSATAKKHPFHHWMPPPPAMTASDADKAEWADGLADYKESAEQLRKCCNLKMGTRKVLGYGMINRPTGKKLTSEELTFLEQNGCPVVQTSEVVER